MLVRVWTLGWVLGEEGAVNWTHTGVLYRTIMIYCSITYNEPVEFIDCAI